MLFDTAKMQMVEKVYYWNARYKGKTAVLSGPFLTAPEAEATADVVSPRFLMECHEAHNATFGVMECKAPGCGEGRYNKILPYNLLGNLAIDTGIRGSN
jgi:hypothetical protein